MKMQIATLFVLSTAAYMPHGFPLTSKRQAAPCLAAGDAVNLINFLFNDLTKVNSFINASPLFSDTPSLSLMEATQIEADELNQVKPLVNLCSPADGAGGQTYLGAINTVQTATPQDLAAFTNIQQGVGAVQDNVNSINTIRCCTILPAYDEIFSVAALTLGIADQLQGVAAPRPTVCEQVAC